MGMDYIRKERHPHRTGTTAGSTPMTSPTNPLDRARVLLSVQRALLMAIIPEMRAVDVSWNDSEIRLRFVLARETNYDMNELTNEVEAEIEADFLPEARVTSTVDLLPVGSPIELLNPLNGGCDRVFALREFE